MTFYHLVNCVLLAVLPYLAVYKLWNLTEYRAFWKCAYAAGTFFAAQLVKMLILASFFPVVDMHSVPFSVTRLVYDFLRLSVDLVDLIALNHVINKLSLKGDLKFVASGLGWAFGDFLAFRVMPFWLEARASEFSWVHLISAMESNINLLYYISISALLWTISRNDFNKVLQPAVIGLMVVSTFRPLLIETLSQAFDFGIWFSLVFKGVYAALLGIVALALYTALTETTINGVKNSRPVS